jgi:chorismate mutase
MGNKPPGNDKKPVQNQVETKQPTVTDEEREQIVFEKLLNSLYAKKFDEEELHDVAKDLCTAKGLRETYLSTNWTETLKIVFIFFLIFKA